MARAVKKKSRFPLKLFCGIAGWPYEALAVRKRTGML